MEIEKLSQEEINNMSFDQGPKGKSIEKSDLVTDQKMNFSFDETDNRNNSSFDQPNYSNQKYSKPMSFNEIPYNSNCLQVSNSVINKSNGNNNNLVFEENYYDSKNNMSFEGNNNTDNLSFDNANNNNDEYIDNNKKSINIEPEIISNDATTFTIHTPTKRKELDDKNMTLQNTRFVNKFECTYQPDISKPNFIFLDEMNNISFEAHEEKSTCNQAEMSADEIKEKNNSITKNIKFLNEEVSPINNIKSNIETSLTNNSDGLKRFFISSIIKKSITALVRNISNAKLFQMMSCFNILNKNIREKENKNLRVFLIKSKIEASINTVISHFNKTNNVKKMHNFNKIKESYSKVKIKELEQLVKDKDMKIDELNNIINKSNSIITSLSYKVKEIEDSQQEFLRLKERVDEQIKSNNQYTNKLKDMNFDIRKFICDLKDILGGNKNNIKSDQIIQIPDLNIKSFNEENIHNNQLLKIKDFKSINELALNYDDDYTPTPKSNAINNFSILNNSNYSFNFTSQRRTQMKLFYLKSKSFL